jgi:hypothetical protein
MKHVSLDYEQRLRNLASLLNTQVEIEYRPSPYDIQDERTGFDLEGNFHRNRWDSEGTYLEREI